MTFLPCVFGLFAFVPSSVGLGRVLAWLCELGGDGLHPLQSPSKTGCPKLSFGWQRNSPDCFHVVFIFLSYFFS